MQQDLEKIVQHFTIHVVFFSIGVVFLTSIHSEWKIKFVTVE